MFFVLEVRNVRMPQVLYRVFRVDERYFRTSVRDGMRFRLIKRDTIAGLRRAGQQFHRRKIQDREQSRKIRESSLYSIKETEPLAPLIKYSSSFLHYCCSTCTPASRVSFCSSSPLRPVVLSETCGLLSIIGPCLACSSPI